MGGPLPTVETEVNGDSKRTNERGPFFPGWEIKFFLIYVPRYRETREGWPLTTAKTKMNGDSKSTNERGPFLLGSLRLLLECR